MQLPLIALACLVLACVDGIIASNIDQQSALSAESVASLPLQSSIPSSATSLFDYLHAYAYFLIIMSPLFLFRTYLVPNPRLIHSLGGVYLAVMICTAGFLWDATLNGRTLPLNFVLLITFPIAIVCASLAGYFQKLGNLILGLLGGLCLGAFFLETKSGGLIDNSYPGRVAFVVIFGLMGAVLSRWDIDLVFSTSLIGSYTLFYAVSTVENTSFHLAPFWLLIESEGGSKYSIGDKERYLIGFALGVFCLSVIVQFAFGPWSSRKGKSLDQSTDCSDLESAHVYGEMQSRI